MSKKQEVNWLQSKAFRFQNKSPNPISHLCKIWRLLGVLTNCSQKFLALNRSLWRWLSVCERGWLAVAVCVRKGFAPSEPTSLIPAPFIILQIQTVSAYLAVQQLDIFWAEKNKTSIILDALNSKQIGIWQCCYAVSAAAAAEAHTYYSSDSGQVQALKNFLKAPNLTDSGAKMAAAAAMTTVNLFGKKETHSNYIFSFLPLCQ